MSVHEQMESLADLLVAGGLGAAERAEADRHAAECASCGTLVREARDFAAWAKGLIRTDAPPADLEDRLISRFRASAQKTKKRFVVGGRVLKVTGSIAAAIGLIVLGSMVHVDPPAAPTVQQGLVLSNSRVEGLAERSQMHVHFTLDHDAHDIPGNVSEIVEGKSKPAIALKSLASAESDFRANDRDWNHINDFWTGDVKQLYDMTTAPLSEKNGQALIDQTRIELNPAFAAEAEKSEAQTKGLALGDGRGVSGEERAKVHADIRLAEAGGNVNTAPLKAPNQIGGLDFLGAVHKDGTPSGPMTGMMNPSTPPVQDNRKIIRTADVSLEVDAYEATSTKLLEIVAAERGFVASANTQRMANGKIQATVVVRVTPDRFDAVIGRLKELGSIRHQSIGSEDVTKAYVDLESRLASKQVLATRLTKLLAEGKGTVKELMEVEVQLGQVNESIEQIKGEIKYYDNRIGLSTITLQISEKDLGQPFEYVQTLQANLSLTAHDPGDAYARAQKEITGAGGQVVDSRMSRQNDGSSTGTIRARVDADKFPALREALRKLGFPTNDTVNQQKSARGGQEGMPKADAPLRKELAVLDLSISSPPVFVTHRAQLLIETPGVESGYASARKSIESVGGKIVDGALVGRGEGMKGSLRAQVDAEQFSALVEVLKKSGTLKTANINHLLPTATVEGPPLLRERAEIELTLASPPQLIPEESGLGRSIRETLTNSWGGLVWSVEKLFVGLSLIGPWVLIAGAGVYVWKKVRRKKVAPGSSP
jgi:glycine cleavage system regulatory protein